MKTERQGLILHSKTPNVFKLVNMKVLLGQMGTRLHHSCFSMMSFIVCI